MKKLILVFTLLVIASTALTAFTLPTSNEKDIAELATQNDKVLKAQCVIYERNCVIAIQTEKFTNRTEYCDYVDNLVEQVKVKYQIDNVYVTRSPKIMHAIERLQDLEENERQQKIQQLIESIAQKPKPLPYFHQGILR